MKDTFLQEISSKDIFAFYETIIVPLDEDTYDKYKLYPDAPRTKEQEKQEYDDIVSTEDKLEEVKVNIIKFAETELELKPITLFFPDRNIIYQLPLYNLQEFAFAWIRYQQILKSMDEYYLEDRQEEYERDIEVYEVKKKLFQNKGIDIRVLIDYYNGRI